MRRRRSSTSRQAESLTRGWWRTRRNCGASWGWPLANVHERQSVVARCRACVSHGSPTTHSAVLAEGAAQPGAPPHRCPVASLLNLKSLGGAARGDQWRCAALEQVSITVAFYLET